MKKTKIIKSGLAVISATAMILGILPYRSLETSAAEKKLTFTVMCDGTLVREEDGAEDFYKQLEEKLDCNITWIRPDYFVYYDSVKAAFKRGNVPDVVLLNSQHLNEYANKGCLWDMTEAWNNSKTKNSGKLSDYAIEYIEENGKAYNTDNKVSMYGFAPQIGNGTITYIKSSYLKSIGVNPEDVKKHSYTYDEFYTGILKAIKNKTPDEVVITSPGFISKEQSYTQYLPQFYQNAQFGFYKNSEGQYVDGFTEQAMKDALLRIKTAVDDGIIDIDSVNYNTNTIRNHFCGGEYSHSKNTKVLSYFTGTWGTTIRDKVNKNNKDEEIVAMLPVNDNGSKYTMRRAPAWAIVDKADGRQQLIFDKFIDTMLDGGDVQMLWTYGAKGTHWDTKEETFTAGGKTYSYKEGEFHMLPCPSKSNSLMSKNHIEPYLSLRKFEEGTIGAQAYENIKKQKYYKQMLEDNEMFMANCEIEPLVPCTESYLKYNDELVSIKENLIYNVITGKMDIDEAMEKYNSSTLLYVTSILVDFNEEEQKELEITASKNETDKQVTFTAAASGGASGYTYKFIVYNKTTGTWGVVQNYSDKNTCTWTKGSAGDRDFYVDVKDADGNVVRSKALNVKIENNKPTAVLIPGVTALSAGDKLTLTASTDKTGCTYKFLIYNPATNQWFKLQDFSSKNTCTWTAGSNGTRQFYVDVKDASGNVTRSKAVNVTIGGEGALTVKTTVSANTTKVGDKITFSAEGVGGKAGYTYKMVVYNKTTKTWGLVQNFNANNKITWTAGSAGDRDFYIDVKDADGKVVRSSVMNVKTSN